MSANAYKPSGSFRTSLSDLAHCARAGQVDTLFRMDNDTAFKRIFSHRIMARHLLDWFVGDVQGARELVARLDLARLRRRPEQTVGGTPGNLHRFANDIVWEAPFTDSPDPDPKAWIELMLLWEFQRTPDWLMPVRIRNYVDCHHLDAWRADGKRFGASDRLQPVLPIVIYTGKEPWTAAQRVIDLVTPVPGELPELTDLPSRRNGLFAGDGYLMLDMRGIERDDFTEDNAVSLLAELTSPSLAGHTARKARKLFDVLASEDRDLRLALLEWIEQESGLDLGVSEMDVVETLRPADREGFFENRRERWSDRIRAEGLAAGREEERQLLVRQVERKFGQGPARRLASLLAGVDDPSRLSEVGTWIIDCETGDDLIARVVGE